MLDFACKTFDLDEVIKCSLGLTKAEYKLLSRLMQGRDWKTTSELAKQSKYSLSAIQRCMKTLYEKGVVERKQVNLEGGGYTYIYRVKDRTELRKVIESILGAWEKKVREELGKWSEAKSFK
jgi:predicted transcriptional regulator